jgi:hypothetical protein
MLSPCGGRNRHVVRSNLGAIHPSRAAACCRPSRGLRGRASCCYSPRDVIVRQGTVSGGDLLAQVDKSPRLIVELGVGDTALDRLPLGQHVWPMCSSLVFFEMRKRVAPRNRLRHGSCLRDAGAEGIEPERLVVAAEKRRALVVAPQMQSREEQVDAQQLHAGDEAEAVVRDLVQGYVAFHGLADDVVPWHLELEVYIH